MARSEKIYFVHVAPNLEIPESVRAQFPELGEPVDETALASLRELVTKHFVNAYENTDLEFRVIEGEVLQELLKSAKANSIDLIITGKNREQEISSLPEKIARKAPCSVLIIPENTEAIITKVLVPLDFSEHSQRAMDVAVAFASTALRKPPIHCLNVYRVPTGYSKTGKTLEEFAEIMKNNAEQSFEKFVQEIDLKGFPAYPIYQLGQNIPQAITDTVNREKVDLLVCGVHGKRTTAALLLGSTTERLVRTTQVPMIIVKQKGSGMNLLEALLKI
jgi:nucleotide-binding universal stress UspA family protein